MDKISIFWFRRDLRLKDNHGLYQALESEKKVLPIFIFDEDILDLLENIGFQAPNCIELFDEHYIFTAKKMHHWDNGL